MALPILTLIGRVASLSEIYRPAASAALSVLQSRGLQYVGINQLREALIAAGYGSYVRHLGEIAEGLFWFYITYILFDCAFY
jgi:hypothetical protein